MVLARNVVLVIDNTRLYRDWRRRRCSENRKRRGNKAEEGSRGHLDIRRAAYKVVEMEIIDRRDDSKKSWRTMTDLFFLAQCRMPLVLRASGCRSTDDGFERNALSHASAVTYHKTAAQGRSIIKETPSSFPHQLNSPRYEVRLRQQASASRRIDLNES